MQYTAQEIHEMAHHKRRGIIRPDTGDLDVSAAFVERGGGLQTKRPPLVILVIITLALAFIGIITYFVAHMPPKT